MGLLLFAAVLIAPWAGAQPSHLQQGVAYFRQQQYGEALEQFQLAHSAHPDDAMIDNLLGITETKLGRLDEANRYYQQAIKLAPNNAAAHRNLGVNYLSTGNYGAAEKELLAAEGLEPQNPFAHSYLARLYLETGRDSDAVKQFKPAQALIEHDPDLLFLMTSAYLRLGDKAEAAALLSKLDEGSSMNVAQEYKLGVLLTADKMYPEAVERFRRIVGMQPKSWESKFDLAIALVNQGALQQAASSLQPLIAEHTGDARPFTLLGALYEATGDLPKALAAYAAAVREDPKSPDRYLDYTRLLMDMDRYGDAARMIAQGMKDTPDTYALKLRMGAIAMTQGQYAEARQSFQQAIEAHPEIALGYIALAQGYMRDGKDEEAAKVLAGARAKLTPDAMVEYLYGLVLTHLSQTPEAVEAFQRSIALNSKVAESHYELGKLYLGAGNVEGARGQFEDVLAIAPDHANAHYQLSRIYARLGETEKSKEMAAQTQALLQKQRQAALELQKKRLGNLQTPVAN
ncbi:MAG: tetratricopeptide repeat protein [Acidobacteriaceae bacterium]